MKYDIVIGIETHIQLNTQTKMFCRCSAQSWEAQPNTQVCPVCLGLPGALPVINQQALHKAMLVGAALNATIATHCKFDRKNYFYPDLAKGYQISQYDQPINSGGYVDIEDTRIGITRAHLEEDVGKLSHEDGRSLVDFNKGGIPLLEIVSEPEITSAAQAKAYVQTLRQIVRYIEVNDGNMEKGVIRADVNISLQEPGKWQYQNGKFTTKDGYKLNNRTEIKNLNSFRSIERAVEYEIKRQAEALQRGQEIVQETRGWDDAKGKTFSQRTKEEAHDYRYFPEPDLPPLEIDEEWVRRVKAELPELPRGKQQRFQKGYGLSEYDARLLSDERLVADWFEKAVVTYGKEAKPVANWMLGEVSRLQNDRQNIVVDSQLQPENLATLLSLLDQGKISATSAKQVLTELYDKGGNPEKIITQRGLEQVSGSQDLEPIAQKVIAENPDAVQKIKDGKSATIQFLVGQVMKETKGRANPAAVVELINKLIN